MYRVCINFGAFCLTTGKYTDAVALYSRALEGSEEKYKPGIRLSRAASLAYAGKYVESAKETGNATSLDRAMNIARVEVTRLQERVDVAKQAKDTEAAVNLGISTKRLLSTLDEAEKL